MKVWLSGKLTVAIETILLAIAESVISRLLYAEDFQDEHEQKIGNEKDLKKSYGLNGEFVGIMDVNVFVK